MDKVLQQKLSLPSAFIHISRQLNIKHRYATRVMRGEPADKAGMKAGDVITEIDGKGIQDSVSAMSVIAGLKPGKEAKFQLTRSDKVIDISVNVAKRRREARDQRQ